jgi:hypothetical protein
LRRLNTVFSAETISRADTNNFKNIRINIVGPGASALLTPVVKNSKATIITIGNSRLEIPVQGNEPVYLDFFTLDGSRAADRIAVTPAIVSGRNGIFEHVNPGMYLVRASARQGSVRQKVLIGR